jgi:hypothetical protein
VSSRLVLSHLAPCVVCQYASRHSTFFSVCMHSALVHHFPHSRSLVNVVALSFYLPSLRQTKSIRTEADFQIFHVSSLVVVLEIIAIKKFKIYLDDITFIGRLSTHILHSRRMQRNSLGVKFSLSPFLLCAYFRSSREARTSSVSCAAAPLRPIGAHNLLGLPHPCIVMSCQRQQSNITLLPTCTLVIKSLCT